jgi:hypothetical protein
MTDRLTAVLHSPRQGHEVFVSVWQTVKEALGAGKRLTLEVKPARKSRDQEEKYHAVLQEIANAMQRAGRPWEVEDVKRLMLEQFAHDTGRPTGRILPSLDGQRLVQTQLQSRKFSKADASEFVEWLHAWCVENGVELSQ